MQAGTRRSLVVWLTIIALVAGCGTAAPSQTPATSLATQAPASTVPSIVPSPSPAPSLLATPPATPGDPSLGQLVVTVSDRLRVRSQPWVGEDSIKYEPVLPIFTELRVLDGPVEGSGYVWYQVEPVGFKGLEPPGHGWVAIAGKDGEPWIAPAEAPVAIAAGGYHTCALTASGGVKCWGYNDSGQVGNGTTIASARPVDVIGLSGGVAAIAAGYYHSCALARGGRVKCWGGNNLGQLGNGTTVTSLVPVDVVGLVGKVVAISAGGVSTCALTDTGAVRCWGANGSGQLGTGTTVDSAIPVDVEGLAAGVTLIAAGPDHTCAVTGRSQVDCWGNNAGGQLGDGWTMATSAAPLRVAGLDGRIVALSTQYSGTCVLLDSGIIECWGGSYRTAAEESTSPVVIVGVEPAAAAVAAGDAYEHACALTTMGGVMCWGLNNHGQIGDGSSSTSQTPVQVVGLERGIRAVTVGYYHSCALTDRFTMMCWGCNYAGGLGDGTTTDSPVPIDVDIAW